MIEKPDIRDEEITGRLWEEYGLPDAHVQFLPLGWDVHTAVYRAVVPEGGAYFLKLRKGTFNPVSVALPRYLAGQGIRAVIAPLETRDRRLWGSLETYKMILYPFIVGRDGYETALDARQWREFGAAMSAIHAAQVPTELAGRIPPEQFSARWRERTLRFLDQVAKEHFEEPIAAKTAAFLNANRGEIERVVRRTARLALELQAHSPAFVLCHNDIHAGNLHITPGGMLYIVDWDEPLFAPRERDLALIGGSHTWQPGQGTGAFYQGYGPVQVDPVGLAYYRYERIVVDIAEFCEQLLSSSGSPEDREQSYRYMTGSFLPGQDLEIATRLDESG